MARKLTLDRTFIHSGIHLGPGLVDIDEAFGKHNYPEEMKAMAFKDLQRKQDEVKGTPTTPISEEKKDGSISATPAINNSPTDTAQPAPKAIVDAKKPA